MLYKTKYGWFSKFSSILALGPGFIIMCEPINRLFNYSIHSKHFKIFLKMSARVDIDRACDLK